MKKIIRIIIWGFAKPTNNSFRHIYKGFYEGAKFLGYETLWLDDIKQNNKKICSGDLVIVANVSCEHLKPKKGVYYCTHNFEEKQLIGMDKDKVLHLQVYTDKCKKGSKKIGTFRYFDKKSKTLYQPWGTNVMPSEFMDPVFPWYSPFVFWIGSIWDNEQHQGNINEISSLKKSLLMHGKMLLHPKFVSDKTGIKYTRLSRVAPAVGGKWQIDENYLPCRLFKNISYGQLGITNIKKFKDLFGRNIIFDKDIDKLVAKSLKLSKKKYIEMVVKQQELIKDFTYASSIKYIIKYI